MVHQRRQQTEIPEELLPNEDGEETHRRRQKVAALYLRGVSQTQMADLFHVDRKTIRRDIEAFHEQMLSERLPTLEDAIAKSLAVHREVLNAAWLVHDRAPDVSTNRVGALNTILLAQAKIDEMEGVSAPEKVNSTAVAQIYAAVTEALREADPELQRRFLLALAQRNGRSLLGRSIVPADDSV